MMLLQRSCPFAARCVIATRNFVSTAKNLQAVGLQSKVLVEDEYDAVAQYPEIQDMSFTARKKRKALSFQESVQKAPTVEEKIIKINMPRYYGYQVVQLHDKSLPYNCMPAIQHYTRTLYEAMPNEINENEKLNVQLKELKGNIEDALELSHDFFSHKYPSTSKLEPMERERMWTQLIVEQINRVLLNSLSDEYQHLREVVVDYNPRHEAFWAVGGILPPKNVVKSKQGQAWHKDLAKEPIDRYMQYKSEPIIAIRHPLQLPTWKNEAEYKNAETAKNLPRIKCDPRTVGFSTGYQHGTNIPGYWPSNAQNFGFLSYQSRTAFHVRPQGEAIDDYNEASHAHAIQSSFAWLLAQANYYGFNTFSELTYPFNTQTVLTDGRIWSFYEYQLNTLLMNGDHIDDNSVVNYCRGTQELTLYQEFDDKGKVVGFNEEVLKYLIKCYTNAPTIQRSIEELQPFLNANCKRIAEYEDDEKTEFLENIFKHLVSNRPRHLAEPEIYMWEKIYKIDNKTRPLEARRRFFELFINPWKRTLDQHQKEYIPRCVRPEGHRSKKKWKPVFYP